MNKAMPWVGGLMVATLIPAAALAHHSFNMFEPQKEQILVGTITKFEWTNPHTWIEIDAPDPKGKMTHWSLECGSVLALIREGWTRTTLRPGDKVSLVMHPLRNGAPGGSLMGVVTAQGKLLGVPLHPPDRKAAGSAS